MKVSQSSVEKIIQIPTEAKVTSVSEVCRKYQVSSSTYYKMVRIGVNALENNSRGNVENKQI